MEWILGALGEEGVQCLDFLSFFSLVGGLDVEEGAVRFFFFSVRDSPVCLSALPTPCAVWGLFFVVLFFFS